MKVAELNTFKISVDSGLLSDLHRRLQSTRWPHQITRERWNAGTDLDYLKELIGRSPRLVPGISLKEVTGALGEVPLIECG